MPLLFVLWTVALLAIVAAASQSSSTLSYTLARNAAELARQEAQAEAALNLAVFALLGTPSLQRKLPQMIQFEGIEHEIEIQDELGRIDLNHADGQLLGNLFRAVGVPAQDAQRVADRIIDWRDSDDLRRLNGAEAREYREAGAAHGPRNGSFQSRDELRLVLGVTNEMFRKVEPVVTIHSGKPSLDPRAALPLARRALAGDGNAVLGDANPAIPIGSLAGRAYAFCINAPAKEGSLVWQAVIRLTGDPAKPYWLLEWDRRPCDAA